MEEVIVNCQKAIEHRRVKRHLDLAYALADIEPAIIQELEKEEAELAGQVETRREFTPTEVQNRLAEIARAERDDELRVDKELKGRLVDASIRLGMMQELESEGIVDAADVQAAQEEVDELKGQLRPEPDPVER